MPDTTTLERPPRAQQRLASDYSTVLKTIQRQGLMRRRYGFYTVKIATLVLAFAGVWVGFAFLGQHWAQIALAAALAVIVTQILLLSHDAAHKQVFRSGKANDFLALILGTGLGGVSLTWWNAKHNKHHQAPNQLGVDPDVIPALVHFYPPENPPRSTIGQYLHSRQGWWFYPLLLVEALNLHAQSVQALAQGKPNARRWWEIALLGFRLGAYPAVLFVFLTPGLAAAFLGVQLAVTGLYLGSVFAASHIGMPIVPKDTKIDFLRRQVLMSRNISGGRLASLAMGGLNYQIEHHLFPSMPRPNLRKARETVREFCQQHNISYQEIPIHRAWAIVAAYLNRVGLAGATAVACPTAAALR